MFLYVISSLRISVYLVKISHIYPLVTVKFLSFLRLFVVQLLYLVKFSLFLRFVVWLPYLVKFLVFVFAVFVVCEMVTVPCEVFAVFDVVTVTCEVLAVFAFLVW